jgi:serine/threonine-protein kinase
VSEALTLPAIGDLVDGKFRIDRKLGEGGTSAVYEVSHVITDKKFAIKWLLPELALDDSAVDRFIHEARVSGRFVHQNAVQIYDICRANNSFYMLLDLLQGESLQTRLERVGRFSVEAACAIVLPCTDVLIAAHRAGIVHRDLKPGNIFLCWGDGQHDETPKLLDFGISKFCAHVQSLSLVNTASGSVIGTPLYMSPEQMLGRPVDPRTDIYALGTVLYELVSGRPPYQADSYADLVVKVTLEAKPASLEGVNPAFAALVERAMAREPADRFASVEEFAQALRAFVAPRTREEGSAAAAEQEPPLSSARKSWVRRHPGVALAAMTLITWTVLVGLQHLRGSSLRARIPAELASPSRHPAPAHFAFAPVPTDPHPIAEVAPPEPKPKVPRAAPAPQHTIARHAPAIAKKAKPANAPATAASPSSAPASHDRARALPEVHVTRADFDGPALSAPPRAVVSRRDF